MIQIFESNPNSTSAKFNRAFGQVVGGANQFAQQQKQTSDIDKKKKAVSDMFGEQVAEMDPDLQKLYIAEQLKSGTKQRESGEELRRNEAVIRDLETQRGLEKGSLQSYVHDPKMAEQISRPEKPTKPTIGTTPVPKVISSKIKQILKDNPNASSDELRSIMDEAEIPPSYSNPYTENRRGTEEQASKNKEDKTRALRQETLPIRTQLANKSLSATQGIQNKQHLLDLIEKGDINDPTFAALAEALPLKLGKRLLSNDTIEYKGGLVEEFNDLKNIFQGATRVKEIELLEEKIADLYLNDEQKKSLLKSRINALKADIIRAEVAEELEGEPLGILQFNKELEKKAKPRLDALFNQILDEQKSIIDNAENRKQLPLDANDPDDQNIIDQILKEAGGDFKKAEKLALKKGYKF